jgi:hypothetical protein
MYGRSASIAVCDHACGSESKEVIAGSKTVDAGAYVRKGLNSEGSMHSIQAKDEPRRL